MKKIVALAFMVLISLSACKDPQKNESVIAQRDSLLSVIQEKENSVNEFISTFNEVERNLDSVAAKQHIIMSNSNKTSDAAIDQKARLNKEIAAINVLMSANSKKLKQLNQRLGAAGKKNAELEKTIATLNNQLNLKYNELSTLNEKLNDMNVEVARLEIVMDTLMLRNSQQAQNINDKANELHKAFYIVGSSVDLQKWNLIDNQGGFLGIGQTSKLSNNLDMNMFTEIDYTQTTVIPVNSKHIKIVTTHPTGSFSLSKTGKMVNSIMISDPEKFWSASKYLVITK